MKTWHTFIRCALAALLLAALPTFVHAQDQIDVSGARVYGSPGDVMRWPVTARLQSVTFTPVGFPTRFDRMSGPNRWPDEITPGWEGPLQYTLGMCLRSKTDGQWDRSAVVQFWYGRQDSDPNSTAAPYAVDKEWFYDAGRWGPLAYRNPAPGEVVGIFVVRGDARGNVPPNRERSNVAAVVWGTNYDGASAGPVVTPTPEPTPAPVPGPAPQPQPAPSAPAPILTGLAQSDQLERIYRDLTDRDERVVRLLEDLQKRNDALSAQLKAHDEHPSWLARVFGNRYVQIALAGIGTYVGREAAK